MIISQDVPKDNFFNHSFQGVAFKMMKHMSSKNIDFNNFLMHALLILKQTNFTLKKLVVP